MVGHDWSNLNPWLRRWDHVARARRRQFASTDDGREGVRATGVMSAARESARAALRASAVSAKPYGLRVHFSNKFIYAQVVRREDGHVVASASSSERGFVDDARAAAVVAAAERGRALAGVDSTAKRVSVSDKRAAALVGARLAERVKAIDLDTVTWNRPYGVRYHGKHAALMEALKANGVGLG